MLLVKTIHCLLNAFIQIIHINQKSGSLWLERSDSISIYISKCAVIFLKQCYKGFHKQLSIWKHLRILEILISGIIHYAKPLCFKRSKDS